MPWLSLKARTGGLVCLRPWCSALEPCALLTGVVVNRHRTFSRCVCAGMCQRLVNTGSLGGRSQDRFSTEFQNRHHSARGRIRHQAQVVEELAERHVNVLSHLAPAFHI